MNLAACCLPSQFPQQKFALPYQQKCSLRTEGSKRSRKKELLIAPAEQSSAAKGGSM